MQFNRKTLLTFFQIAVGIFMFVFAIELLTGSINAFSSVLQKFVNFINNPADALGVGWISSYALLSGYPVTILGLSLFDSELISEVATFFMINGSRLGAPLIIILIGVVDSLKERGPNMLEGASLGILTLSITYIIVLPSILVGFLLHDLNFLTTSLEVGPLSLIDIVYHPIIQSIIEFAGPFIGIVLAFLSLFLSLSIFEGIFNSIDIDTFRSSWLNDVINKTRYSFLLGAIITFFFQSVALSIGLIVPLYNKEFLKRENLVPYILGACVTTFGATLIAAMLIGNVTAINLILIILLAHFIVATIYLLFYQRFYTVVSNLVNIFLENRKRFVAILGIMFIIPFLLIFLV